MKHNDPMYLLPHQAAAKMGISVSTLWKYVQAGKLSALKTLGNQNRFLKSSIEALVKELQTTNIEKGENEK